MKQQTVWRDVDPDEEENPADIAEDVPFAVGGGGTEVSNSNHPTADGSGDIAKDSQRASTDEKSQEHA